MRWTLAVAGVIALAGCKARHDEPPRAAPSAPPADAAAADANLDGCRAALPRIAALPPVERPQALIDACQPCGDWSVLLAWNTPATEGGPSHAALAAALLACHAYCDGNAKQRFLGVLDDARGQSTRGPWRLLGEVCKAQVSAEPDARYMSAPLFALDRIARAIGDGGPAITMPLPPVSVTGVGIELPAATGAAPGAIDGDAGAAAVTVDARSVLLGQLPAARLTGHGLAVTGDYPGAVVALDQLAARLAPATSVLVIAPHALPAARVAEVVAALPRMTVRLAIAAPSPRGWSLPGALPLRLSVTAAPGTAAVHLAADDKVDDLVGKLTKAMAPGITGAALIR